MVLLGGGIAGLVFLALFISSRAEERRESGRSSVRDRNSIAASILVQVAQLGGAPADRAGAIVRDEASVLTPTVPGVDVSSWAEAYARASTPAQREWLLDAAVRVAMKTNAQLPIAQYNALIDLSFALGFQTDALARLRSQYDFTYEDHAKRGRPRSADRGGGAVPLFIRGDIDTRKLLNVLELPGGVSRHDVISAYRRLAAQHHPDRYHDAPPELQRAAAIRFMELTEAYEKLLASMPEVDPAERSW